MAGMATGMGSGEAIGSGACIHDSRLFQPLRHPVVRGRIHRPLPRARRRRSGRRDRVAAGGVRRLAHARQGALAQGFAASGGLWRLASLALLDLLAVLALVVIVHAALGTLFNRAGAQTQLAGLVLNGLVTWRLLMLVFR